MVSVPEIKRLKNECPDTLPKMNVAASKQERIESPNHPLFREKGTPPDFFAYKKRKEFFVDGRRVEAFQFSKKQASA